MRFDSSGNITVVELVSSRITQNSDENNYIDCKTVRIFALVANDIVLPLRAKDLERDANVEWVLLHPVRDSRFARAYGLAVISHHSSDFSSKNRLSVLQFNVHKTFRAYEIGRPSSRSYICVLFSLFQV